MAFPSFPLGREPTGLVTLGFSSMIPAIGGADRGYDRSSPAVAVSTAKFDKSQKLDLS
jgi:hypothetical protein